jgi:predicted dehydrogenase
VDYTQSSPIFALRKVLRYTRLYGPGRTLVKVRGQYHMRTTKPPRLGAPGRDDAHVGIIGCGNFAYSHIAYFLTRKKGHVIRGVMDIEVARAASLAKRYRAHYATDDADRVISDPSIDLIYIASNHASHADYAVRALEAGKMVHIEKPHAVSREQLRMLVDAMDRTQNPVRLGFNRPESRLGQEVRTLLAEQSGAAMLNWYVAGHDIPAGHWYYRDEEGGRILGNLCHWTDFVLQMVPEEGRFPIEIHPVRAQQSDADVAVTYRFGDGSIAAITFSAKGHAFEGVRERFSAHKGDLLLTMSDFREMRAEVKHKRRRVRLTFRDHGHSDAILRSYAMTGRSSERMPGLSPAHVWETAELFLATREALEASEMRMVDGFASAVPSAVSG